jgi:hypothetical protein
MPPWSPVDLLPGLVCGLLAALLLGALRRWFDPLPAPVAAVFALVVLALFGPVLFGGKVLLPVDNLRGHVPFEGLRPTEPAGNSLQGDLIQLVAPSQREVRRALAAGRWPLWNPRAGGGMALLADPQAQVLQPLQLAVWFLPVPRAAGVVAALRILLALVFTYLLLRRQGAGGGPALAGSLAFGLGGFAVLWVGWPIGTSAALLPAVLYALVRCDQEGGRRDRLLLALTLWTLLLGGHPETIAAVVGFAALVLADVARRRPAGARLALVRSAALALALAAAAAAPALLPFRHALPQSLRTDRLAAPLPPDPAGATFGERLVRRAVPSAAPNAYGNSRHAAYWGPASTNEDAGAFAGTAALLLALLALLPARRRLPLEGPALAAGALGFLLACRPPGLAALLVALPPLRAVLTPRLLLLTGFALAVLAAGALERLRQGELRRRAALPVLAAGALGLAALFVWAYLAPDPTGLDRLAVLRDGWLRWQLRFLAATVVVLAAAVAGRALRVGRIPRVLAPVAVALLLAAELLLLHRPANPPMPRELAFPSDSALRFLTERVGENHGRGMVAESELIPARRIAGLGRALPPNLAGLWGLADARVYNPLAPHSWAAATAPVTVDWWGEVPLWDRPTHPLYGRLGVRYLLAAPGRRLPPPLLLVHRGSSGWVWEVPGSRPLVFRRGDRLITSLSQDGGWRLLAAGRPWRTARGPFVRAGRLPPEAALSLIYRPPGFLAGCLLAALGIGLGLAAHLRPPRRDTIGP